MSAIPFVLKLKDQLAEDAWCWVTAALRQDALVWGKLESDESLASRALSAFGSDAGKWSPAGLALLEAGSSLSLDSLRSDPLRPLPQPLCAQAVSAYKAWQREAGGALGLAEAGLVALSLRERRRVTGSWKGLADELKGRRAMGSILACLYGLAPDAEDFLLALLGQGSPTPQAALALHSLLSNPLPPPAQCDLLQRLASKLHPATGLAERF
jgi:hypothetical protein